MNYYNYFTEVEEYFVRRRGKSLMVSPLDWSLITLWRDSGVPLHVVLRGIDKAMDKFFSTKRRESEKPGTLFYCHDAVMAEYALHLEAHVGEAGSAVDESTPPTTPASSQESVSRDGPGKDQILRFLGARISEIEAAPAKHSIGESAVEALGRARARLQELTGSVSSASQIDSEALERDLRILDEQLVSELRHETGQERLNEWEQEAKRELKIYRKRLAKESYEKIRDNFVRAKIRRLFGLGELSLFNL